MMKPIYVVCLIQLTAFSCGLRSEATRMQEFVGSQIHIPVQLAAKIMERDTVVPTADTLSPAKVLVYYNAEGCTPCKLKELLQWGSYMTEMWAESIVPVFYILNTKQITPRELGWTLAGFRFEYPVLLDTAGSFERLNPNLPKNPVFHTFLLDRNNRVVLVGSPVGNPKMWSLYKETIQKLAASGGQLKSSDHTSPLRNLTPQIEKNAYSWSKEKP